MSGWRLDRGGEIDRDRPIGFTFDGHAVTGFAGDTLASALLASGRRVLGRSFKYHRPRGLWGAGAEEPNAIVDVTEGGVTTPNLRATLEPLREGLALRSVNTWPEAARDRHRLLDRLNRFLPAGFYYKTFMAGGWMRWEPMIRRMAGLGRLDPANAPPADCAQINARADLLVIGAGPAGLAAARAAARAGRAVWLIDDGDAPGGSLRWRGGDIDGGPWRDWCADTQERILRAGGKILSRTTLWGAFDHGLYAAWERRCGAPDRLWRIRAGDVILAAGAIERPLWFANNDLPGVISAEAALRYLTLHGAVAGRRIVLATGNDGSYPVAAALARAGCDVTLADARGDTPDAPEGVDLRRETRVTGAEGRDAVARVRLNGVLQEADTLLVSGGLTPSVHIFMQAGGRLDWDAECDALIPRAGSASMRVAGAANGAFALADALAEGHAAAGGAGNAPRAEAAGDWGVLPMRPDPDAAGRQWIDFQNDVTLKDVALAQREGFVSVEHLKRYTTLGMATDQGRTSNFAGLAAMAGLTDRSIPETGTTTYRPPFLPVPLTVIAGRRRGQLFDPPRRLTLERAHRAAGAQLREYGGWLRPAHYGDDEAEAALREAGVARETVALYDASPLGKIEVIGPGAAELLDFCFFTRLSTLKPGRARYGLMLSETGIVFDDGVTLRLAGDRFIVSASSSHVDGVRLRLEDARQDRFDPARVFLHDVTAHWTTLCVAGPRARDVLRAAGVPVDLDDAALPHMGVTEADWNGRTLRIARVSFTGERSYELSVPSRHAEWLESLLAARVGEAGGGRIGLEAVLTLRAQKGFILIGKDTDGLTMPQDLGWPNRREDEFIGKRSLLTDEALRNDRRQLVGLTATDGGAAFTAGAHLVPLDAARRSLGFVTSVAPDPGAPHALALLESGRSRMGESVGVFDNGAVREARVIAPCAFDAKGERLHA
ncbi:FAD-dependent oxidoreductase [Roseovarius spongiae]|uniref:FAD-dependent oxidoreductase n=1 Tax=Roseovarius spongiae TaxID=2320272 RepID=A0A3A8BAI5_9RHOB|nr:2Fe-2S iron-sulfur cluster-binding protein [Roseovarius spongiae]RKF16152.1 FAD-dependent oxidoreductase [Roseovarius spongiae]